MSVSWLDDGQAWHTMTLGTDRLPGVARVSGDLQRDIDVQKTKGQDGATFQDNGYTPATIDVEWRFLPNDYTEVIRIVRAIKPKPGAARTPLGVVFPPLADYGISFVYVKSVSLPEIDKGIGSVKLVLLEYVAQPKKTKSGGASQAAGPGTLPRGSCAPIDFGPGLARARRDPKGSHRPREKSVRCRMGGHHAGGPWRAAGVRSVMPGEIATIIVEEFKDELVMMVRDSTSATRHA